ncbi:hypothetical protein ACVWYH_002249 [Bradyrhizobium sp. GM24.11]
MTIVALLGSDRDGDVMVGGRSSPRCWRAPASKADGTLPECPLIATLFREGSVN